MQLRYRPSALGRVGVLAACISCLVVAQSCNDIQDEDLSSVRNLPRFNSTNHPCKPSHASCYAAGPDGPGNECMAMRDNSKERHIQQRQTYARNTRPPGLAGHPLLSALLNRAAQFKSQECNTQNGTSGYMLLLDWDQSDPVITNQRSYQGYAERIWGTNDSATAIANGGLCMTTFKFEATGMNPDPSKVGPQTWVVKPVVNRRLAQDFDLKMDLAQLRATIPEGEGIFYYDEAKRRVHGYAPLAYVVATVLEEPTGAGTSAVPIRDAELTITSNDETKNCAGRYRVDKLKADECESTSIPLWGCLHDTGDPECDKNSGTCCDPGKSQGSNLGHFRIADLERIKTPLGESLCITYVGGAAPAEAANWMAPGKAYCSSHPEWGKGTAGDPLRRGDWCSQENKPADGTCVADSWLTVTDLAFQAFPIQLGTDDKPKTCVPTGLQPAN
jgi:hypothetical protein